MPSEVTGISELLSNLKKVGENGKTAIEEALTKGALRVVRDAKINAPVDTTRLRSSITFVEHDFGTNNPYVEVGTNVEYAPYQEFGTSKIPAHPFLFPAYNSNRSKIISDLAKALKGSAKR